MEFQSTHEYIDYLDTYKEQLPVEAIRLERKARDVKKESPQIKAYSDYLAKIPLFQTSTFDFTKDSVTVGNANDITSEQQANLKKHLENFIPWKKGPWNFYGIEIDAEWQSHIKWNRLKNSLHSLEGKKVADIGCNNGYFMFRMLEENPETVIGFEPFAKHYYVYNIFQNVVKSPKLHFELLGIENFDLYPKFFDTIFCLGILYHHTDPIGLLRKLYNSLDKGGEIYIDCQGIPGNEPIALMPKSKYTSARGFWWLPTKACLKHWLSRTQFRDIEFIFEEPLSLTEQRSTEWSPHDSLEQFLDPKDPTKTIEGYPAPWRYYVRAKR